MSSAEETGPLRAWVALVALALALGVSTAVQWEVLPPAWLPQLPLLWGLAAVLGAAAWRFSTPVVRGRPRLDLTDAGSSPRVFLSPLVLAAFALLLGADVLLYLDLRSPAGTLLWALSLAAVPAAFAWRERSAGTPVTASKTSRAWLWRAAAVAVVALALGLRVFQLEEIPDKYLDDEGSVSDWGLNYLHGTPIFGQHLAESLPLFRNGATAYPILGSYVHALVMRVAGESVFGSRLTAALAGTVCVAIVFLILKENVSRWAALAASFLFACCHTHLYWSRQGISQSLTTATIAAVFWLTLRAIGSGRFAGFAVAGVLLGLAQYFYEGARFFIPVLGVFFVVQAATEKGFVRRRGVHVVLMAATAILVFAPIGFWYIQYPGELLSRSRGVLIFSQPDYLASRYPGLDTTGIVLAQLRRGLEGLAYRGDGSNFFALRGPILDPVTRVFLLTGAVATWALRHRLRLLVSLWIWIPIAIVCVPTVDPPSMTRLIQAVPALFLVVGLVIEHLREVTRRAVGRAGGVGLAVLIAGALAYAAEWNLSEFFDRYPREHVADAQTLGGKVARQYGPEYQVSVSHEPFSWYSPTVRFLARGIAGGDVPETEIPLAVRGHRNHLVLIEPKAEEGIAKLRAAYPGALQEEHRNRRGELLLHSFRVPAAVANEAAGPSATWKVPDARIGKRGKRLGELDGSRALAVDARGWLYVADTGNRRVQVFDGDGNPAFDFGGPGRGAGAGEVGIPFGLTFLSDGSLLVASREPASLKRFSPDGQWRGDVLVKEKVESPVSVAPIGDGFVVLDLTVPEILRIDGEGKVVARVGKPGAGPGELSNPGALATSADGRVFVFDRGNQRVQVFSPMLAYEREWPLNIDSDRLGQMIAIGPPGAERVYIANANAGAAQRFTPDGALEWNVGQRGDYPGNIAWPVAVTVDTAGNVYLYDESRAQIFRYDLSRDPALTRQK